MPARWLSILLLFLSMQVHADELVALAYHDITPDGSGDGYSISQKAFAEQIDYLRAHGYTPISLKYLDRVRGGQASLPDKAVMLTFDDGLESYSRIALPLLARYGYPSVISIVTAWHDGRLVPDNYRGRLMTWAQLKEVSRSPLVEVLSHTDALHQGIMANPQGNKTPAARTRVYDAKTARYETEENFSVRIRSDLIRARARIRAELAVDPLGIAWPYGQFDQTVVDVATDLGLTYQLTLDNTPNRLDELPRINRITFRKYRGISDLQAALAYHELRNRQLRFVEIDLAGFSGNTAAGQEELLSSLLNRLALLRVNSVVIDPFTPRGDKAFFYNRQMPVDSDILHRVLTQIVSRLGLTNVYLKLPARIPPGATSGLYRDLARINRFNGVIFAGDTQVSTLQTLREQFAYYQPGIRFFHSGKCDSMPLGDSCYLEVDPGTADAAIASRVRHAGQDGTPPLVVIRRNADTTEKRLIRIMAVLRDSAVRHYGYAPDDYVDNRPAVLKVVSALHAHTIAVPEI